MLTRRAWFKGLAALIPLPFCRRLFTDEPKGIKRTMRFMKWPQPPPAGRSSDVLMEGLRLVSEDESPQ